MSEVGRLRWLRHHLHQYLLNSSCKEDIIQSKHLAHLEGRCLHQNDTQFTIDYLRKQSGRKTSATYHPQDGSYQPIVGGDNRVDNSYYPTLDHDIDFLSILKHFDSTDQELIILNYIAEYTEAELITLFNMTEHSVRTSRARLKTKLRAIMTRLGYP